MNSQLKKIMALPNRPIHLTSSNPAMSSLHLPAETQNVLSQVVSLSALLLICIPLLHSWQKA